MTSNTIISALCKLGELMNSLGKKDDWPGFEIGITEDEFNSIDQIIQTVHHRNSWFTENYVRMAFASWGELLTEQNLKNWIASYSVKDCEHKIGIIMAGNLPLVGFHDLVSVILANQRALVKMSSDDNLLMPALLNVLYAHCPDLKNRIALVDVLENYDAVIATGSNNSSRYFEAYFGHVPHIIRKNRTSIGIVKKNTTDKELKSLGKDIFSYYGLGCRNVTKVFFEQGFELDRFFSAIYDYNGVVNMNKYANNYDYHKALFLMNKEEFLDNGFLLLKESEDDFSPVGVLNYEYYSSQEELNLKIENRKEHTQCIVSAGDVPFGKSQHPQMTDYADGVDTLKFLTELN